jgi:hypothetical protein
MCCILLELPNLEHREQKLSFSEHSLKKNNELQPDSSSFILYQDDNGVTNINVRLDGGD